MGRASVDRDSKYMYQMWGTTNLITDYWSLPHKTEDPEDPKYDIPEDRYSRPCGGSGGFDDYVERWHE